MDKNKVAAELVKLAKSLLSEEKTADLFDTEERTYEMVTAEQLMAIKRLARKYRGLVKKGRCRVRGNNGFCEIQRQLP